jgi:methionyl aminopeptidase
MIIETEDDKKQLRAAGNILSAVLKDLEAACKEGITTAELDLMAEHAIKAHGAVAVFLGYKPEGAPSPYPAALCVSINDEVVHGIPSQDRILRQGDIVSLDLGLSYNGYFVDSARTLTIGGDGDAAARKLLAATREALGAAIGAARAGAHTGDIGAAVERVARKYKLGVVKDLGGHAVGRAVHEKPYIGNEGVEGEGEILPAGMVLAIEPMLAEGKGDIIVAADGWTYKMRDRSRAAHFEQTIIVTDGAAEILTAL